MKNKQVREKLEKIIKNNSSKFFLEESFETFSFKFILTEKPIIIENSFKGISNPFSMYIRSHHLFESVKFEDIYKIISYEITSKISGIKIELKNGAEITLK